MKQSNKFLHLGEGKAWLARNKNALPPEFDPVQQFIVKAELIPRNVLEIGCADGWRLKQLKETYACQIDGVDPSAERHAWIKTTTADRLGYRNYSFDLVIFGFCLYLVDREDLFKVAYEGDRVLKNGGHLLIHDFNTHDPYKVRYKHQDGIFSYKMDYQALWLANPAYQRVDAAFNKEEGTSVVLLKKDTNKGWPLHDEE